MSKIDEKFEKLIAEKKAAAEVKEEVVESVEVSEDAATGNTAITGGAVPQQKSDLKNDAVEVASSNAKDKIFQVFCDQPAIGVYLLFNQRFLKSLRLMY